MLVVILLCEWCFLVNVWLIVLFLLLSLVLCVLSGYASLLFVGADAVLFLRWVLGLLLVIWFGCV